mgnify:CR=1 FL=1
METEVTIRQATLADLAAVLRVQQASPGAAAWSHADYESFLANSDAIFLVAGAPAVVGFLTARVVSDELEILNLAVEPAQRGRGIAARLLGQTLAEARARNVRSAWLEVRASNQRARAFYRSFGFQEVLHRPRYYHNPEEDAVVCRRLLQPHPTP